MIVDFSAYQNVILDFDGVILDSNLVKEKAIRKVANSFLGNAESEEFVNFFISNNGLPREIKIKKFVSDNVIFKEFLNSYNAILSRKLKKARLTTNAIPFLKMLASFRLPLYVLSGGDEKEVIFLLEDKQLLSSFKKVMGGPQTKYKNISDINLCGKTLYIGDSQIDYEVAKSFDFDFIFMYQYTQFKEWRKYFECKNKVKIIKNFKSLLDENFQMEANQPC